MLRLLSKNLLRNKRRTLLTCASAAISLFLLSSLAILYAAFGHPLQGPSPRMMVRRSVGIMFPMPLSYRARIRAVPGVAAISTMNWFGGYWVDRKNTFANFAIDADTVFDVLGSQVHIPPEELQAFKGERLSAVCGKQLADKYHWKVGDRITLLGSPYNFAPTLWLRGIFTGGPEDMFYFHYDYLNETMRQRNYADRVGLYWIRLERPDEATQVGKTIDEMFRNSSNETKTESESNFLLGFISMLGNVRKLVLLIGSAVTFAILLIVANTMAMSIRERVAEAAVMRVLGFRMRQIVILLVGESLALTLIGALIGVGGAKLLYDSLRLTKVNDMVWADLRMRPETLGFCFLVAVLVGLAASGWPAWRAAHVKLANALRYIG